MATQRRRIKQGPFRLNEPPIRVAGGMRRSSLTAKGTAFANIRARERLYSVLLQHDPDNGPPLFTAKDMIILRQIATEGPLTNHVPAIRRSDHSPRQFSDIGESRAAGRVGYCGRRLLRQKLCIVGVGPDRIEADGAAVA
jgi:hypothetical protein